MFCYCSFVSFASQELIKRLLSREVQTRLGNLKNGTDDIKAAKWFEDFDFEALSRRELKAPWIPNIRSITDTSNFDPFVADDHVDTGYIDASNWDNDF